jgi:hypothetical protein
LDFVGDQNDSVLRRNFAQTPEELGRHGQKPSFPLNWLYDNRGDGRRVYLSG